MRRKRTISPSLVYCNQNVITKMPAKVEVKKVTDPTELEKVFAIRREVFVGEQNCPPELEWENEDVSHHFLATVDNEPAGASRWRQTDKGYKLERFAVLSKFRGN